MRRSVMTSVAFALLASSFGASAADAFPSRPIKLVVPFPPGGTSDIVARVVAKGMSERLGQPIVIDNRAGAGTLIGTEYVAKSPPDGYTMFWMATPFAINETLYKQLPYSTFKSFTPVIDLASVPLVMIVHPSSPARSVADLVAMAKKNPGKLTYGSSGNGGSPHLAMEMFKSQTGTDITHVPYKGSAPSVMDLLAGQTDVVMDTLFLIQPHVASGKARALAQSGVTRSTLMPNVPTMREEGLPGYEATSWLALSVPAGTPPEIIARLNATANDVLNAPAVRESLRSQGLDVLGGSPEDSARHLQAEVKRWGDAVRSSGAKAD